MVDYQLTTKERKQVKEKILKFVKRRLDPKCETDRDPEGIKVLPTLIEILIQRF